MLQIPRSSLYYQKGVALARQDGKEPKRRGPCRKDDTGLLELIKAGITQSPFHNEGYRKIWARLRFQSVIVSKGRVLRIMRENNWIGSELIWTGTFR